MKKKYEYKTIFCADDSLQASLDLWASEGWELFSVVRRFGTHEYWMIWKREA